MRGLGVLCTWYMTRTNGANGAYGTWYTPYTPCTPRIRYLVHTNTPPTLPPRAQQHARYLLLTRGIE